MTTFIEEHMPFSRFYASLKCLLVSILVGVPLGIIAGSMMVDFGNCSGPGGIACIGLPFQILGSGILNALFVGPVVYIASRFFYDDDELGGSNWKKLLFIVEEIIGWVLIGILLFVGLKLAVDILS